MSNVAGVIFTDLPARVIPKLRELIDGRPEPYTEGVAVANKHLPGNARTVTVNAGPSIGAFNTLDDPTLRINVRALDEGDAADLTSLVRAIFEAPAPLGLRDGDPITACRITAGPIEVPNDTEFFQWYMVANVTRRGIQFT